MIRIRFAAAAAAALFACAAVPAIAQTAAPDDPYKGMSCDDMMTKAVSLNNRMPASDKRTTANTEIKAARTAEVTGEVGACKTHLRAALGDMM